MTNSIKTAVKVLLTLTAPVWAVPVVLICMVGMVMLVLFEAVYDLIDDLWS